jgi:OOP family OmpA-OmpF porin
MGVEIINKKTVHVALAIVCFLFIVSDSIAQIQERNLIPNPGFETYKGKRPLPVIQSAKPWLNVGTVDYFIKTDPQDTSAFKGPHSGKSYVGIRFQAKYKEYAYVKLIEPLKKGREYYFSMFVRLNDISTVSIRQLGVYLSDSPFQMGMIFNQEGIVDTTYESGLSGNYGWIPISKKYVAKGGEKYLIIGNFTTDTKEDFVVKNKWKIFELKEAYYYIDDIVLMDTSIVKPTHLVLKDTIKGIAEVDTATHINSFADVRTVYFENASHRLQKNSIIIIDQIVALLNANSAIELSIEGYTDNMGHPEKNIALSKERAQAVYEELRNRGVKNNMVVEGLGEANPIVPNSTSENRAKNRRVEVHMIKKY